MGKACPEGAWASFSPDPEGMAAKGRGAKVPLVGVRCHSDAQSQFLLLWRPGEGVACAVVVHLVNGAEGEQRRLLWHEDEPKDCFNVCLGDGVDFEIPQDLE